MKDQADLAEKYFNDWASDYELAFKENGGEKNILHRLINLLFRRKTFRLRTQHLFSMLNEINVKGKEVFDIGCGTGQLSLYIADNGGKVTGYDISKEMIRVCNEKAKLSEVEGTVKFQTANCVKEELPKADIILCISVIEYYKEIDSFIRKLCDSTLDALIICDARFVWWRVFLRFLLARLKGFVVYYHKPSKIKSLALESGMNLIREIEGHSFRIFLFRRQKEISE